MKYFTPERYLALQNSDPKALDAADADWDAAVSRYEAYLQTILLELPPSVKQLLDGFYLHDARVLSIGRRGDAFVVSLQLDVPPQELLTVTYTLAGQPEVNQNAFTPPGREYAPLWLYEEIEAADLGDARSFVQDVLLSNGWALRIPFSDIEIQRAEDV